MLLYARCPVVNPPSNAYSNYSKPHQLRLLAEGSLDIPHSIVTNIPDQVVRFRDALQGRVIIKGVSNIPTLARVWDKEHTARLDLLVNSPTLFQEYVAGVDYRVHVVGTRAFVTRLISQDEDYRRSALVEETEIYVEEACLPAAVVERCIAITRELGLVVSGIDFKQTQDGRLVALEVNPFPQFTFYEGRSGQPITRAVVEHLISHQVAHANVWA
jgi:glutathione synthase/RimK-type ligase-like ATP-grasp enzyme